MDKYKLYLICSLILVISKQQNIDTLITLTEKHEKVELREELDQFTQELVTKKNPYYPLYHSYIFNSGVGNREELQLESLKKVMEFNTGEGVISWQSVQSAGFIYLLGRKLQSVSLVITSTQLLSKKSAYFSEHSLGLGSNVSSASLFTRWNPVSLKTEVIAVIAVNSLYADILWFRVTDSKLENITHWAHFRKTGSIATCNINGKNQLIIVSTGSPSIVDVFDINFGLDRTSLDIRLIQSFHLDGDCTSVNIFSVGRQLFLTFVLPKQQSMAVYKLAPSTPSHFEQHTSLSLPRVTQVITFCIAHQVYLAVNGDSAYVFRVTEYGNFIPELMPGHVSEWLVMPVFSYRDDVALFSRSENITNFFVWTGNKIGFKTIPMLKVDDSSLEGDWLGAVSIPFQHQYCVLLPQYKGNSRLITIETSLNENTNPVLENLVSLEKSMKYFEDALNKVKSQLSKSEETLRSIIKFNGKNVISAKWKLSNLRTPKLYMNSIIHPKFEVNDSRQMLDTEEMDIVTLKKMVNETITDGENLIIAVEKREKNLWGLEEFTGKVTFKRHLAINNLTITSLNNHHINHVLQNTFRGDKPQAIKGSVVVESLQTRNLITIKINNSTQECLKFNDKPVVFKGNTTFRYPLIVRGDIKLTPGGRVNGINLSKKLCHNKQNCSVFPKNNVEARGGDFDNTMKKVVILDTTNNWKTVLSGRNLTVLSMNGVDWNNLTNTAVYTNRHEQIPGTIAINGAVQTLSPIWGVKIRDTYFPKQEGSEMVSSNLKMMLNGKMPLPAYRAVPKDNQSSKFFRVTTFSDLVVTGTVTCGESVWGTSASDVLLKDFTPIQINTEKNFITNISIRNNLEVKGLVAGNNVSNLLTKNSQQIFNGPIAFNGNITINSVFLTGLWNEQNITDHKSRDRIFISPVSNDSSIKIVANSVKVLKTLNGIPSSELVFKNKNLTSLKELSTKHINVARDINVDGKVSDIILGDFNNLRLSIKEEQVITGRSSVIKVNITNEFMTENLNNIEMSSSIGNAIELPVADVLYLSELNVFGNITTSFGMNGYNLSELTENAVYLHSNNNIKGHLTFKDEVSFALLECQGFLNHKPCQDIFDITDILYKTNETVFLTGEHTLLNPLHISEDLHIEEINGYKFRDILNKNTVQDLKGDVVTENMTITEESTLLGLFNSKNISEISNRCSLSDNVIRCEGNFGFNSSVVVKNLNSSGLVNGLDLNNFLESFVNIYNPQLITGLKKFTEKTTEIKKLTVQTINDHGWNDFLLDSVTQGAHEDVESSIHFTETIAVDDLSVNFNLDANSINNVTLNEWPASALFLNDTFFLKRALHLKSASSLGNITISEYGNVDMGLDVIRLHATNNIHNLKFRSLTVEGKVDIANIVNSHFLGYLEKNTLKISGDWTVTSDFVLVGDLVVFGNVTTLSEVNHHDLRNVITLGSRQILNGSYNFKCMDALHDVLFSELMSGVNLTEWKKEAILTDSDQDVSGTLSITGDVHLRGPVKGLERLGDIDLATLNKNITQNILNVHQEMKTNLSCACNETNYRLASARNQEIDLLYLHNSQEIPVTDGVSLLTHFKVGNENFMAISENNCITTFYKWDKIRVLFLKLYRQNLGYALNQLITLQKENQIYLVTVTSELSKNCTNNGLHMWLFTEQQLKYVSQIKIQFDDKLQGYGDYLYSMNITGVFKWDFVDINGTVSFKNIYKWFMNTGGMNFVPQDAGLGLALQDSAHIVPLESKFTWIPELYRNCTDEVHSFSVDPKHEFFAIATTESMKVPRYSDDVKVFQQNGKLFDKWSAQHASFLRWLPIPGQTWLILLHNYSTLQLYQLQGILKGFQLRLSAEVEATHIVPCSLPLVSKVNLQPYLIIQTKSSVKILRAILQGDPFLGSDIICNFNQDLVTVPDTL